MTTKRTRKLRSHCPVNFGLEAFGDKWTLLILRDIIFRGKKTFGEFLKSEEKFATNILTARLSHLLEQEILTKEPLAEDNRKDAYRLTEKGLNLIPMIFEMMLWSAQYDDKSEAHRITALIELIRKDNRSISEVAKEKVRRGEGIVMDYLNR